MISVCMATYNGEKYVLRQLESVMKQLDENDEIVIVDDCSTDKTIEIIKNEYGDKINIHLNESNIGAIKSFEKAISISTGDIICLCDQDDIWIENKIEKLLETFKNDEAILIVHDAVVVDGNLEVIHHSWNEYNNNKKNGIVGTIMKNGFTGACMAFKKQLVPFILPLPTSIQMHDQWIALVCMMENEKLVYIDEPLIKYVRHGDNVTGIKKRSLLEQAKGRLGTIKAVSKFKKQHIK